MKYILDDVDECWHQQRFVKVKEIELGTRFWSQTYFPRPLIHQWNVSTLFNWDKFVVLLIFPWSNIRTVKSSIFFSKLCIIPLSSDDHNRTMLSKVNGSSCGSRISPRWGCQPSRGHQHTILPNFPKNCLKLTLKKFGSGRGSTRPKFYYVA